MGNVKKIMLLLLALVLTVGLVIPVGAQPVPEPDRECSVTITVQVAGIPVAGGELAVYRVGDIAQDDGNYFFVPTAEFAGADVSFDNIQDPALALVLEQYALEQGIGPLAVKTVGEDGKVVFDGLEPGLYLITQPVAAEGYQSLAPFLVSLPYYDGEEYIYDLDAVPKTQPEPIPTEPTEPTDPTDPTEPDDPDLPQTGQLNWPVPVLVIGGLTVFMLGWWLCFGKRARHEK